YLLEQHRERSVGREAAAFDLLVHQQRIPEAVEVLRNAMSIEENEEISAVDILRRYLAGEIAKTKTDHYSKKALGLTHDENFQPTGFVPSDGARAVLRFCHEYGLPELIEEAGERMAERTKVTDLTALPTFCVWASSYPELRELAIGTAMTACAAGVPSRFAVVPMCNPYSQQGRWYGAFVSPAEKRGQLLHGVRNGGWGSLGKLKQEWRQSPDVGGYLAMATGAWEDAALAFSDAVAQSGTLQEASVFSYLTSVSYARAGQPEAAEQWYQTAEAIPLADEEARSALADVMQRFRDHEAALRNRRQLIELHAQDAPTVHYLHALRLVARAQDLSEPGTLPFSSMVAAQLVNAVERSGRNWAISGEVAWDAAFYHQCRMLKALQDKRPDIATNELLAAHRCSPGALDVFELIVSMKDNGGKNLFRVAREFVARTGNVWEQAAEAFPGNDAISRKISQCRDLRDRLVASIESDQ
ncbi:MAG: hypothetical protein O3C21_14145, partial [Verrucomicrobia bacterium]|nr:hypothetical protein [Verrucomicrobiota bacterium]